MGKFIWFAYDNGLLVSSLKYFSCMNPPAKKHEAYQPTLVEQIANIITHGVSINKPEIPATFWLDPMSAPKRLCSVSGG